MAALSSPDGVGKVMGSEEKRTLFVGSFNINSSDLGKEEARAWLARAADADIVAIGLQECAVVPAKPFPSPTNGKAVVMWRDAEKKLLRQDNSAATDADISPPKTNALGGLLKGAFNADVASDHAGDKHEGRDLRKSLAMAGMVQAAMAKASIPPPVNVTVKTSVEEAEPIAAGLTRDVSYEGPDSPTTSIDDSDRVTRRFTRKISKGMRQESYYLRGVVEAERDERLLSTINDCIPGRELVADVAMGETPTYGKIEVKLSPTRSRPATVHLGPDGDVTMLEHMKRSSSTSKLNLDCVDSSTGCANSTDSSDGDGCVCEETALETKSKAVEWYGTIRLLVFVRKGLYSNLNVKTVVIPAGDKPSVVADAPEDYAKDTSPDKGAVACHLQDLHGEYPLDLLLVNCHLYGTNKYGVPEAVFDKYRMAQLRATDHALRASLPETATYRMVLLGDLNFRVELKPDEEDKARGGKDYQSVVKVAQDGDLASLLALYDKGDRLRPLLSKRGRAQQTNEQQAHNSDAGAGAYNKINGQNRDEIEDVIPGLLEGLHDGLGEALGRGRAIRPTFTYKPRDSSQKPRRYNDKRTPSWTDRILWRGFGEVEQEALVQEFASVPDVIASDHEPVYCLLSLSGGASA